MNVDKVGTKALEAYVSKTQAPAEKPSSLTRKDVTRSGGDEVSISKAAREMQDAQKAVREAPDVREAKVAALKKQVQEGTYNVSSEALVEKMSSVLKGS